MNIYTVFQLAFSIVISWNFLHVADEETYARLDDLASALKFVFSDLLYCLCWHFYHHISTLDFLQ